MQAALLYDTAASNYLLPVFVHLFLCSDLYDHLIANLYYGYLWQYFCSYEVNMQPESALIAVWILQRSVLHGFNYCKSCYFIGRGGGGMNTTVVHGACIMLCILFISLSPSI
jgi:hypothetical protein